MIQGLFIDFEENKVLNKLIVRSWNFLCFFFETVRENKEHRLSQHVKALMKQEGPKHLLDLPRSLYHLKIDTFYTLVFLP